MNTLRPYLHPSASGPRHDKGMTLTPKMPPPPRQDVGSSAR